MTTRDNYCRVYARADLITYYDDWHDNHCDIGNYCDEVRARLLLRQLQCDVDGV